MWIEGRVLGSEHFRPSLRVRHDDMRIRSITATMLIAPDRGRKLPETELRHVVRLMPAEVALAKENRDMRGEPAGGSFPAHRGFQDDPFPQGPLVERVVIS